MEVLIGFVSAFAFLWAFVLQMKVHFATIDKLPEEFQDGRFGVEPEFALSPLTPLTVQADYVKAGFILCVALLGFSVCAFLLENTKVGWILLLVFLIGVYSAVKSLKTYRENRIEGTHRNSEESDD
jgi:hypothetical protein